jgi:hypothetical protein
VTISGAGFGSSPGSVAFNGTTSTPASWSNVQIVAPVPAGASTGDVIVTANGQQSNGLLFTTNAPVILSVLPPSGPVGNTVTLTGTSFGSAQGNSTVTLAGIAMPVVSWSNTGTSIQAQVPGSAPAGQDNIVVTVNNQPSNSAQFTVTPNITGLSLPQGPPLMGLIITGTSFGNSQGNSTVTLNGTAMPVVAWSSDTSITVQVPTGATSGNIVITVNSAQSNGFPFTVTGTFPCP